MLVRWPLKDTPVLNSPHMHAAFELAWFLGALLAKGGGQEGGLQFERHGTAPSLRASTRSVSVVANDPLYTVMCEVWISSCWKL